MGKVITLGTFILVLGLGMMFNAEAQGRKIREWLNSRQGDRPPGLEGVALPQAVTDASPGHRDFIIFVRIVGGLLMIIGGSIVISALMGLG